MSMNAEYIRNKITQLRLQKNVSEHRMSLDLGHARSYIHGIVSGRTLPSMQEFLAICDYFEITPEQFFYENNDSVNPTLLSGLIHEANKLSEEDLSLILVLVKKIISGYPGSK